MTTNETADADQANSRREDALEFAEAIFPPGATGIMHTAFGPDPYWDAKLGKYKFPKEKWTERARDYPAGLGPAIDLMLKAVDANTDTYMCTGLAHKTRDLGSLKGIWALHADWDGDEADRTACLDTVQQLGGFAINSGTWPHLQCFLPLAEPVTAAARYTTLCRAFAAKLPPGADSKIAWNDVLRTPGTYSLKSTVRPGDTGQPTLVTWALKPTGARINTIDQVLGVSNLDTPQTGGGSSSSTATSGPVLMAEPPGGLKYYRKVAEAVAEPKLKAADGSIDRSDTIWNICLACAKENLELVHARWCVALKSELREKLAEQGSRDDVAVSFYKALESRQRVRRDRSGGSTAEEFLGPNVNDIDGGASATAAEGRILTMLRVSDIEDDIPDWVWEHDGYGRIQRGVLSLFAGRPGAGKSTAARWFAARASRGELGGLWEGKPQTCAYIASEESARYVIKPGLRAAGADMSRIIMPQVKFNDRVVSLMAEADEKALTEQLVAESVTWVFIDPVMSTVKGKVDIYRNNEMREALAPWGRIAEAINGGMVAIVHLNKGLNGDVLAAINGSSALGEVARCVFGFAKDPEAEDRVMSQVKNSCGREDLSITYEIEGKVITPDSKRKGIMPLFTITGDSDTSVGEILNSGAQGRKGAGALQPVLNLVNSRDETIADDVVGAKLAKDKKLASQMLNRLYKRGLVDRPQHGSYTPLPKASKGKEK